MITKKQNTGLKKFLKQIKKMDLIISFSTPLDHHLTGSIGDLSLLWPAGITLENKSILNQCDNISIKDNKKFIIIINKNIYQNILTIFLVINLINKLLINLISNPFILLRYREKPF